MINISKKLFSDIIVIIIMIKYNNDIYNILYQLDCNVEYIGYAINVCPDDLWKRTYLLWRAMLPLSDLSRAYLGFYLLCGK